MTGYTVPRAIGRTAVSAFACIFLSCFCVVDCDSLGVATCYAQVPRVAWEKTYGGSAWDIGNDVEAIGDRGYIIAGATYS